MKKKYKNGATRRCSPNVKYHAAAGKKNTARRGAPPPPLVFGRRAAADENLTAHSSNCGLRYCAWPPSCGTVKAASFTPLAVQCSAVTGPLQLTAVLLLNNVLIGWCRARVILLLCSRSPAQGNAVTEPLQLTAVLLPNSQVIVLKGNSRIVWQNSFF